MKQAAGKPRRNRTGKAQIPRLVDELDQLTRTYLAGDDPDDLEHYRLYPPATSKQIAAYEKKLGTELPPSYRELLALHNGWLGFWGDTALVGVPARYNAEYHAAFKEYLVRWDDYTTEEDHEDPRFDVIRARDVLPIGTGLNWNLLGFDRRRRDRNGELEVIDCMHTNGVVDNRHASFVAFLQNRIACTRMWIEEQQKKQKKRRPRACGVRPPDPKRFDAKKRAALVKKIDLLSKRKDTGEVFVPAEDFFGGNDDALSIMNLPGSLAMHTVKCLLLGLRRRKAVQAVLAQVDVTIGIDEGEWPAAQHFYVFCRAGRDDVQRWVSPLNTEEENHPAPNPVVTRTRKKDMVHPGLPRLEQGVRIYEVTWMV